VLISHILEYWSNHLIDLLLTFRLWTIGHGHNTNLVIIFYIHVPVVSASLDLGSDDAGSVEY